MTTSLLSDITGVISDLSPLLVVLIIVMVFTLRDGVIGGLKRLGARFLVVEPSQPASSVDLGENGRMGDAGVFDPEELLAASEEMSGSTSPVTDRD